MSVAIGKLQGVESVSVSLNEGLADVKLKPGNRLDPERIRQAARDAGFTPKGSDVQVAGRVSKRGASAALEVTGLDVVYILSEHPEAEGRVSELQETAMGKKVVVSGHLPETATAPGPGAPRTLRVRQFTIEQRE